MWSVLPASSPVFREHNCSAWPDVQENPDIAGNGILIGFLLSAAFTLILVILYYVSVPQRTHENPLDRWFINSIRPSCWEESKAAREIWTAAMEASILMFSDTQLVTGMAILLCGYTQLDDGLAPYYWQVVISLAWFSSLAHLATLTSLRMYFYDRPMMAVCRAGYMAALLILLIVSYGTTGYLPQYYFGDDVSWPAKCLFSPASMGNMVDSWRPLYNYPFVIISIAFLVISYLTRVVRIFKQTATLAERSLKIIPRKHLRSWHKKTARHAELEQQRTLRVMRNAIYFGIAVVYIILKALYDVGGSMLWEITWLIAALAWGCLRIGGLRTIAGRGETLGKNNWSFGQILPLLLLFLPFWTIMSTVYDIRYQRQQTATNFASVTCPQNVEGNPSENTLHQDNPIEILDVSDCTWYSKLVILIFGFALVLIGDFLYNFPASPINKFWSWSTDGLGYGNDTGFIVLQYSILLSLLWYYYCQSNLCVLAVHLKALKGSPPVVNQRHCLSLIIRKTIFGEVLWYVLIVVLVVGLVVFDWFIFDTSKPLWGKVLANYATFSN